MRAKARAYFASCSNCFTYDGLILRWLVAPSHTDQARAAAVSSRASLLVSRR